MRDLGRLLHREKHRRRTDDGNISAALNIFAEIFEKVD